MRYRILLSTFLAIMITLGLVSCSEEGSSGQATWYDRNTLYSYSGNQGNLWDHMRGNLRMPTYAYQPQVRAQIHWFQKHQAYLNHVIAESAPYVYYIYQQTQKRNLPAELAFIPVIESDYNPYARSRVGAMGLWQMMPKTALGFGLKRDWWYDGRKDIVASTNAALRYFTFLHSTFHGNWLLAIAAYDCGEGTVISATRYNEYHHRSGDFWNLPLPNETRNYVPRLLAVAAIVRSPRRYGINLAPVNDAPYLTEVDMKTPINLSRAAKLAQVPLSTLKVLNPGVQHDSTDPHGPYTIVVPQDKAETFKQKLATLTHDEELKWQQHVVQSRETLAKIAQKYRTNIALLKQINDLKSNHIKPNQVLIIPTPTPTVGTKPTLVASNDQPTDDMSTVNKITSDQNNSADDSAATADTSSLGITYKVKKGDDLHKIAHKFHTSVSTLRNANGLKKSHVKIGELLVIPAKHLINTSLSHHHSKHRHTANQDQAVETPKATQTLSHRVYIVRKGDYIERIARRNHVSVDDLKKWNEQLSDHNLQPGQKVIIQKSA